MLSTPDCEREYPLITIDLAQVDAKCDDLTLPSGPVLTDSAVDFVIMIPSYWVIGMPARSSWSLAVHDQVNFLG